MEEYNETSFINDIKKSKVVSKASSKVTSVKPDIFWKFLKALIMGLGKAILFAPLSYHSSAPPHPYYPILHQNHIENIYM